MQERGEVADKGGQKGNSNAANEEKRMLHDEIFVSETQLHDETALPKTLSEVGITPVQSHRFKTLADMPEEVFEKDRFP